MNDAAVPTKKKKTVIPDDAPMPHKYEAIEKDDGSIQYFEHVMRAGIHFRQRAVPVHVGVWLGGFADRGARRAPLCVWLRLASSPLPLRQTNKRSGIAGGALE